MSDASTEGARADDLAEVGLEILDARLPAWGFPRWGSAGAAGLDLHACLDLPLDLPAGGPPALIPAGCRLLIRDPRWCGLIVPRSGRGHGDGLVLGNGTGVIDADYAGPLLISAWNRNPAPGPAIRIAPGERIAQLVFTRVARPRLVPVTADAADVGPGRGPGGFGSTGR